MVDGNFSSSRLRNSNAKDKKPPLWDDSVIINKAVAEKVLDDYMKNKKEPKKPKTEEICSNFTATDPLNSAKLKKMDETGIVGIVCSHRVLRKAVNIYT